MASDLEIAQLHLNAWLEADLAVSHGQSYTMGTRTLNRANAAEIRKNIDYWQVKIDAMKKGSVRFYQGVPQ